jgi:hypothetical protein
MLRAFLFAVTVAAAFLPDVARAGVTLHYRGTVRSESDVNAIVSKTVEFAKARSWAFEKRSDGVVVRPHAWCEPVALLFEGRVLSENWVKTQFAGPDVHIGVVDLFRLLEPRFEQLSISDEGEYWETSNRENLLLRMQSDGLMMIRLQEREPGSTGPYVVANGRVLDVVTPGRDPSAAALVAGQLKEAGAQLLKAPFVPPLPWVPKVPRLAPNPAGRWQHLEFKADRFASSFPSPPERIAHAGGVTYRSKVGGVVFRVTAVEPFKGDDAAQALVDFPSALANKYVGKILADERTTLNGGQLPLE